LSIKWLLIALLIWPAMTLVINPVARTLDGPASYPIFSFLGQPWMFFPGTFLNGLVVGIRKEFGRRGYMLPRLQSRWSALISSLILGVFWAPAHLANWFVPPGDPIRTDSFWAFAV
jgi:membrane protease YdiL (CAAX protease family)